MPFRNHQGDTLIEFIRTFYFEGILAAVLELIIFQVCSQSMVVFFLLLILRIRRGEHAWTNWSSVCSNETHKETS